MVFESKYRLSLELYAAATHQGMEVQLATKAKELITFKESENGDK